VGEHQEHGPNLHTTPRYEPSGETATGLANRIPRQTRKLSAERLRLSDCRRAQASPDKIRNANRGSWKASHRKKKNTNDTCSSPLCSPCRQTTLVDQATTSHTRPHGGTAGPSEPTCCRGKGLLLIEGGRRCYTNGGPWRCSQPAKQIPSASS